MFLAFFSTAMRAPGRQLAFRRAVAVHVLLLAVLSLSLWDTASPNQLILVGQILLVLGLVEGAAMIGWRLTQLPKSQAMEFFLASPIQPKRLFVSELLVGVGRFALVCLSGLPVFVPLVIRDILTTADVFVLLVMPFAWGTFAGVAITSWVYEPILIRKLGELFALFGVLVYLVVGVLAGENLRMWLEQLPDTLGRSIFYTVLYLHTMNPFGVLRYWFDPTHTSFLAWERFTSLHLFALVVMPLLAIRAAFRLRGHFQDRHYRPLSSDRASEVDRIQDRPLSWWAVRRVMEYSGRVNLWLAGGFSLVYAAHIMAGDAWPAWMGKAVFGIFEQWGGGPMVATSLVILSAVPAVYQFGLWDSSTSARCQRLELLLLTDLTATDYAHASFSAAWRRGRGYLVGAMMFWVALAVAGKIAWWDSVAAMLGAVAIWALAFAMGYRGFASGNQTNGIASLFTLGLPLVLVMLWRTGNAELASLLPIAATFVPLKTGVTWAWLVGFLITSGTAYWLLRVGLARCDADLRRWYDANQGNKSME
jgi:hypothetical protein